MTNSTREAQARSISPSRSSGVAPKARARLGFRVQGLGFRVLVCGLAKEK